MRHAFAIVFGLVLLTTTPALADDLPPPKVCVMVAGDPDPVVQRASAALLDFISAHVDLRGVVDEATRDTLAGRPRGEPDLEWLRSARRSLTGTDGDATSLDGVADRLGCALMVEVTARPSGTRFRFYDAVHHVFGAGPANATVDAPAANDMIIPAARATIATVPPSSAPGSSGAPGSGAPPAVGAAASSAPISSSSSPPPDARVTASSSSPPPGPAQRGIFNSTTIGWAIALTAATLLIVGFVAAESAGPGSPVISVRLTGSPP